MLTIFYYCLKVLLCSGLLFGYYLLALRNKRFHEWNRYYLLLVVIASFTIPFLQIPLFYNAENPDPNIVLRGLKLVDYGGGPAVVAARENWFSMEKISSGIYLLISFFFLWQLLKTFAWIKTLKKNYAAEKLDEISFYNTAEEGAPFSFFRNIFWHHDIEANSSKGLQMLRHEITHVRQLHSVDKILLEVATIFAWWNPFFYLIKKELSTIHEFIADQRAAHGEDHLQYASLLLSKALGSNNLPLTNPFFHSQLKRRIMMLTNNKNPRFSYLRRMMVLPVAASMFLLLAFKLKEKESQQQLKTPVQLTVVIDAAHGGTDIGAIGANNVTEKELTLTIANKIASLAEARGIEVILTRTTDELPGGGNDKTAGLKNRLLVGEGKADVFISLHMNSTPPRKNRNNEAIRDEQILRGSEVYIATKDNGLASKNQLLATSIMDELGNSGLPMRKEIRQIKDNPIYVLEQNKLPAVLIEVAYITNPADLTFITKASNQEIVANKILDGLVKVAAAMKNKTATNLKQKPVDPTVLQAFYPDTPKVTITRRDSLTTKYNGKTILSVTPTDDEKGYVVKTSDSKSYFLTKEEAKKEWGDKIPSRTLTAKAGSGQKLRITGGLDSTWSNRVLFVVNAEITDKQGLDEVNPDDIESVNILKGESAILKYGAKAANGVIEVKLKSRIVSTEKSRDPYEKTFTKVEVSPEFPGGIEGWRNYLQRNMRYPEQAQKNGTQGNITVQFVVLPDGSLEEIKAINDLGYGLKEEAERIIAKGPKWEPAVQNGKKVRYRMQQIITFKMIK